MKKIFFFTTIIFASLLWGDRRLTAQTANEPGSGNALEFNGTSNYVNTNNTTLLNTANGTIEFWMNWNGAKYGLPFIKTTSFTTNGGNKFVEILLTGQVNWTVIENSSTPHTASSVFNLIPGRWYHITAIWGTGGMKLYINGVLEGTNAYAGGGDYSNEFVTIGNWLYHPTQGFSGQLDEVRIWNRTLTQAEIQQNMCQKLADCADPNLVGYWRFDEGTDNTCSGGQDVCDASCNGNHGVKF